MVTEHEALLTLETRGPKCPTAGTLFLSWEVSQVACYGLSINLQDLCRELLVAICFLEYPLDIGILNFVKRGEVFTRITLQNRM